MLNTYNEFISKCRNKNKILVCLAKALKIIVKKRNISRQKLE